MPDPKTPESPADDSAERLDRTSGATDDTATTMRLKVLNLEGELWPEDQGRADREEEATNPPGAGETGNGD